MRHANHLIVVLTVGLGLLAPFRADATTYYMDSTAGADSNAGTSRSAAWATWGKLVDALNTATIKAGDTVLMRPGRYYANQGKARWFLNGPGGTAASPITISVDTNYAGNVEVAGSIKAGLSGASAWAQAKACSSGSAVKVPCDSDTDCPGNGTCSAVANVFYSSTSNMWDTIGVTSGTAFQPGATPGATPKLFEVLYSPPQTPIVMPTFTSGHDQVWVYSETVSNSTGNICRSAGVPWRCCTGNGNGPTCTKSGRVYVRTASGVQPDQVSPAVEMTYGSIFDVNSTTAPTAYIKFTNNGNGRTFYFWWSTKVLMYFRNAHHITFEDFDLGYNSVMFPISDQASSPSRPAWIDSGSGWPRNNGGSSYLVQYHPNSGGRVGYMTWRRGKVHSSSGDEAWHIGADAVSAGRCTTVADCTATSNGIPAACSAGSCIYTTTGNDVFDTVEVFDTPWGVLNNQKPNAVSVAQSWPPPNYPAAWANIYKTHWSPLGGGGQSGSAWIIQSPNNRFTNVYVHDAGQLRFECDASCYAWGQIVERSTFDFGFVRYGADANSGLLPALPVATCDFGPAGSNCRGFGGRRGMDFPPGYSYPGVPGSIVRNSVFKNAYGQAISYNCCGMPSRSPGLNNQFVNNTVEMKGDGAYSTSAYNLYIAENFGSPGSPGIFKNNIFIQKGTITSGPFVSFSNAGIGNIEIDGNQWGTGMSWKWGASAATSSFSAFRAAAQASRGGNEVNSFQADPAFVSATDFHTVNGSNSTDKGVDLRSIGVAVDLDGTPRPQGGAFDVGAYEALTSGIAPPVLQSVEPLP